MAEENTILGEEFAETNEVEELAEANTNPAPEGLWTVSPFNVEFTSDAEGDTTYILFSAEDLTPFYATADETLGREAGWHLGIKFNEPEGMTDEARAAVKYSFDNNPASGLYSNEPTYSDKYLELWVRLTEE